MPAPKRGNVGQLGGKPSMTVKAIKDEKMWAVYYPDGAIVLWTLRNARDNSLIAFDTEFPGFKPLSKGYTVRKVQVTVTPI